MKPLVTSYRDVPAAVTVAGVVQPGYCEASYAGTFFYCKSAAFAFRMAFDAGQYFDWDGGYKIANTPFGKIVFANDQPFPLRIYFSVATEAVDYIGTNDQKDTPTFARGNQGNGFYVAAPTVQKAGGGNWAPAAGVAPDLTANSLIFAPGLYQGHRRKQITFQNNGTQSLAVFDPTGGLFATIANNDVPIAFMTSADFYLGGIGGTAGQVFISEIFYTN